MSLFRMLFLLVALVACDDVAEAPAEGPVRHEIEVDARGYHPERVQARAGEPVTLIFTRTTEEGCGEELVIAAHDIHRELPVGEAVEITFTPEAGEVGFACGMDMYRGTVVVQ
jgi:plastocyanin domain-containing protein